MWNPFAKSDLPLTPEELELQRKRQKQILYVGAAFLLLIAIGLLTARPVHGAIRGWQARRHAAKALEAIDKEQWAVAQEEARQAYQLRPTEPQAIRSIARLFSRAGQIDGLKFWKELEERTALTRTDLRDEASLAIRGRETQMAEDAIKKLLSKENGGPAAGDWLLAEELALQEQDPDRTVMYAREVFGSSSATDRDQLQALMNFDAALRLKEVSDRSEVAARLSSLAHGNGPIALEAAVALGQRILNGSATASAVGVMSYEELIRVLENHPSAKPAHKLLALDLKIHQHPEEKDGLISAAVEQFKNADQASLVSLAAWLNSHGEYQRELDAIPRQRALQTRELFFQHVDALGALDRWDEIRRLIESEQFTLDPVVEHMYLARCFAQQNQTGGAQNNWDRALEAAAGDAAKLMTLGEYAEKNGALDIAATAYEAAVAVSPRSRPAHQGRLRIAYVHRDTKKIFAVLSDLLKIWPNDPAVQNDEAYARLLLLPSDKQLDEHERAELESIEKLGESLLKKEPASLPHRTLLALARLRLNRPQDALLVYENINVPKASLTTSSIAVHAAVLAATGHEDEARTEASQVPVDKVLPEERQLIPQ